MNIKKWALILIVTGIGLLSRREASAGVTVNTSSRVSVSTSPASPTIVVAPDPKAKRTTVINNATDYILIGDYSTTFSSHASTGTARIPGNSAWSPDGPTEPYTGGLKAVGSGSGPVVIDVIRVR